MSQCRIALKETDDHKTTPLGAIVTERRVNLYNVRAWSHFEGYPKEEPDTFAGPEMLFGGMGSRWRLSGEMAGYIPVVTGLAPGSPESHGSGLLFFARSAIKLP